MKKKIGKLKIVFVVYVILSNALANNVSIIPEGMKKANELEGLFSEIMQNTSLNWRKVETSN